MIGGLTLEDAMAPELFRNPSSPPPLIAIPLVALMEDLEPEQLTGVLFGGYFQLYFPWLTKPGEVLESSELNAELENSWGATVAYLEDRLGRISTVESALSGGSVTMASMVRIRWILPSATTAPESLERVFYGLRASATVPFIRFFPSGGRQSPLLKLGLHPNGTPLISDSTILTNYLKYTAPKSQSVIVGKIPLVSKYVEKGAAFTLLMFEDGSCDISLEVPQRGQIYASIVVSEAEHTLVKILQELGFNPNSMELRDLHATYNLTYCQHRYLGYQVIY